MSPRLLLLVSLLAFLNTWGAELDPFYTSKANKAKEEAEEAFKKKDYQSAIHRYKYLLDTLKVKDERAVLNLGHAYMRNADYANALSAYTESSKASDKDIQSVGFQQLGILKSEKGEREEAIAYFKNALRSNPSNKEARQNFELLLKKKEMPKPQDQKDRKEQEKKNQDQQQKKNEEKKDEKEKGGKKETQDPDKDKQKQQGDSEKKEKGEDKEKKGEKGDKKDEKRNPDKKEGNENENKKNNNPDKPGEKEQPKEKPDEKGEKQGKVDKPSEKETGKKDKAQTQSTVVNKEQLQKMNMTEQQAKALLNAMRQQEVQYIQQMKKQPSKKGDTNSKDW